MHFILVLSPPLLLKAERNQPPGHLLTSPETSSLCLPDELLLTAPPFVRGRHDRLPRVRADNHTASSGVRKVGRLLATSETRYYDNAISLVDQDDPLNHKKKQSGIPPAAAS